MTTKRDNYGAIEHSILYAETGGSCPLCTQPIIFKKNGSKKLNKGYEIAHIYPLNPTQLQIKASSLDEATRNRGYQSMKSGYRHFLAL